MHEISTDGYVQDFLMLHLQWRWLFLYADVYKCCRTLAVQRIWQCVLEFLHCFIELEGLLWCVIAVFAVACTSAVPAYFTPCVSSSNFVSGSVSHLCFKGDPWWVLLVSFLCDDRVACMTCMAGLGVCVCAARCFVLTVMVSILLYFVEAMESFSQ